MIAHVVMFQPKAGLSGEQRRTLAGVLSHALRDIPSIRRARVGKRVTHGRPYEALMHVNYEYAAVLEFDDVDGLKAYLEHPAHQALAARFFESFEEALMYDFELTDGEAGLADLI
jgi:hypothetical protein